MKILFPFIFCLVMSGLFLFSCSDDKSEDPTAQLRFEYDFQVDGEPLEFGKVYQLNNTAVSFSVAHYYIGGLSILLENGGLIDLTPFYLLAGVGYSVDVDAEFEISDIVRTEFFIGVDPVNNSQSEMDFTSREEADPLSIKDPSMHWNWNTGYKFLRIDGNVDTDDDGEIDTPVAYHIGTDALLSNYIFTNAFDIQPGRNILYFTLDLDKFFEGVDISTEIDTHTGNNLPLAEKLVENLQEAISINR